MHFGPTFARALIPAALVAAAAPAVAQSSDMAALRSHITSVQTMTANFVQTDARSRSAAGKLQLKRPGKVRFEYGSGDLLLVADGSRLNFIDYQVGQKSSWPLNRTPLGVLLSNSPNLNGRAQIVPSKDPRIVTVRARDPAQYGSVVLAFIKSPSAPVACSSTAGRRSTRRTSGPRCGCRTCATMSRCPRPRSASPNRRSVARSVAVRDCSSRRQALTIIA
ncbi:outer membrane lipoprotein carrier protein LolA [Sphingomonas lutea]|uniref:outer membrane lipoprotein carrier protein LolA n=1 Tax=Sphingomonas lutea TaxID=1045317 RepID=UPI001FD25F4A|nr:outer membrane lipoprotein carrier protein LolA [Sphingomonas lutea]